MGSLSGDEVKNVSLQICTVKTIIEKNYILLTFCIFVTFVLNFYFFCHFYSYYLAFFTLISLLFFHQKIIYDMNIL